MIQYIIDNKLEITAALVTLAGVIVYITPSKKDDAFLSKIKKLLHIK